MEVIAPVNAITIRPASVDDVSLAVEVLRLSMGDFADQMFGKIPGTPTESVLAELFSKGDGRFSYRYGRIAEWNGEAAGLVIAYPSSSIPRLDTQMGFYLLARLGIKRLTCLAWSLLPYASVRETGRGEYYVCNLGVSPRFQGRGIGSRLLTDTEEQARKQGMKKCSLLVDLDNTGARRLYERSGYAILRSWKIQLRDGRVDGVHRMVKNLT